MSSTILVAATTPAQPGRLFQDLLPWLGALVALVVIGGIIVALVRRSLRSDAGASPGGFSLQELRDLHDAGELSDEEFERAKAKLIGAYGAARVNDRTPPAAG